MSEVFSTVYVSSRAVAVRASFQSSVIGCMAGFAGAGFAGAGAGAVFEGAAGFDGFDFGAESTELHAISVATAVPRTPMRMRDAITRGQNHVYESRWTMSASRTPPVLRAPMPLRPIAARSLR